MNRRIDVNTLRAELDDILRAAEHEDARIIVEQDGKPAVPIMSVRDYINAIAPAPAWLEEQWRRSESLGTDEMTMEQIDAEIGSDRRERAEAAALET